jgi:hypothetical protein
VRISANLTLIFLLIGEANIYKYFLMKPLLLLLIIATAVQAAELTHSFKSPAFTGVGYSSHMLTMESLARNREITLKDKASAKLAAELAAAENTPVSQFMVNLQARIYSQIAAQVTNQLFKADTTSGSFQLPEGAFVTWTVNNGVASLSIFDPMKNSTTTLKIPVSSLVLSSPGGG